MPYESEKANPYGYEPLLTDAFLAERLSTYRFSPPDEEKQAERLKAFKVIPAVELTTSLAYEDLTHAYGIDGSISAPTPESGLDLAALKLALVEQRLDSPPAATGLVNPSAVGSAFQRNHLVGVMPGEGVYDPLLGDTLDKFRLELWLTAKHWRVPMGASPSLLEVLFSLIPSDRHICLKCGATSERLALSHPTAAGECTACYEPVYQTDFLVPFFKKSLKSDYYTNIMLFFERVLMAAVMAEAPNPESSLFILDGPLSIYSVQVFNDFLLQPLQKRHAMAPLMGLEKKGAFQNLLRDPQADAKLAPGMVGMLTVPLAHMITGAAPSAKKEFYAYGKRFLYRTQDGSKVFGLNLVPQEGRPYKGHRADEWENYPHLHLACQFLEREQTNAFGLGVAALHVIAEANHAASMPKVLSTRFLEELLRRE